MSDQDLQTVPPMGLSAKLGLACLVIVAVVVFMGGSWYIVESFLHVTSGQCLGPICIGGP